MYSWIQTQKWKNCILKILNAMTQVPIKKDKVYSIIHWKVFLKKIQINKIPVKIGTIIFVIIEKISKEREVSNILFF